MKLVDFIILGVISAGCIFAIIKMIKNKTEGKCNFGCGANCNNCKNTR